MRFEDWFKTHFSVESLKEGEVRFPCPKCEHPSFYFSLRKQVGYCHRDSCHWSPTLKELSEVVGSLPTEYYEVLKPHPVQEVKFPPFARPLVTFDGTSFKINDQQSFEALEFRNLTIQDCYKFDIKTDHNKIYIPVYEDGQLVQYVGRSIDRNNLPVAFFKTGKAQRYVYFPGAKIGHYFLGWSEVKLWENVTLVENSFVSIWLRNHFQCTTNFGSRLTITQIEKIVSSKLKSVIFLWDNGAEESMRSAMGKLNRVGIKTCAILLPSGQPDDYPLNSIIGWVEAAKYCLKNNILFHKVEKDLPQ